MKKIITFIFTIILICLLTCLVGCSNNHINENEIIDGVLISVYETKYNGNNLKKYPSKILTDTTILNMFENSTGTEVFEPDGDIKVLYNLFYTAVNNEEIKVIIQNNGKVTFMSIGLPHSMYYLTEDELVAVLELLE